MGRVLLAAVLVVLATGVASAAPTRKVTFETDPPGATVYLGDKESGAVGTTPCTVDLPYGDNTVIIELAAYVSEIEKVTVVKAKRGDRKPMAVSYTLTKAIGTIVVDGSGSAKGATINIDGAAKGKAPARIDIEAGAHQVQVVAGTKILFDDFVTVDAGAEAAVTPKSDGGSDSGADHTHHEREDPDDDTGELHANAPEGPPRPTIIALGALTEFGFRHFTYSGAANSTTFVNYTQTGQVAFAIEGELWPFARTHLNPLKPLSVYVHIGVYSVLQDVQGTMLSLTTFWHTYEVSARYRHSIGDKLAIEGSVGFALDQYQFNGMTGDLHTVPDVEYTGARAGVRLFAPLGAIEPYLALESRIVHADLIGSTLTASDTDGNRIALGVSVHSGRWRARVEASWLKYSMSLNSGDATGTPTSAGDSIRSIVVSVGASY